MGARIMRDVRKGRQWAEWRMRAVGLLPTRFRARRVETIAIPTVFIPPNADSDPRFQVQFLQNVLHVLLHGAGAAAKNLADLGITLRSGDPFYDL